MGTIGTDEADGCGRLGWDDDGRWFRMRLFVCVLLFLVFVVVCLVWFG